MTPFQIQLTMANHDVNIFGGISKSKDYSPRFDPSRYTLDKTMTFHGVWNECKAPKKSSKPERQVESQQ